MVGRILSKLRSEIEELEVSVGAAAGNDGNPERTQNNDVIVHRHVSPQTSLYLFNIARRDSHMS